MLELLAISRMLSARSPSWVLCCQLCLTSQGKREKSMERSGPTPSTFRREGWPGGGGMGVRFLRLSPPTLGAIRRGQRRGAQLDAEFAFYASRRRRWAQSGGGGAGVRSWTESSFPTPLAADLWPGSEGLAAERHSAGRRDRFLRLSPPTSGLAHRGRRRGQAAGRGVRFLRLLCQLRAWPAGGGGGPGGVRSWTGILLPTPLAADFGPNPQGVEEGGAAGQRGWFPSPLSADFWLGPETAAAEGRSAGTRVRFLRLSPPTSGLAQRWQRGGAQ